MIGFNLEISGLPIGLIFLGLGLMGLIVGLFKKKNSVNRVSADNGSVAVGGNNTAPITITNTQQKDDFQKSGLTVLDVWNTICGAATLIGLGVVLAPMLKG